MELTEKQKCGLTKSNARLNIFHGAVRSGKSVVANIRFLKFLATELKENSDLLVSGVSLDSIRRNVIEPIRELVGSDLAYNQYNNKASLWGCKLHCFPASKSGTEASIQGSEFAGALSDELTKHNQGFVDMLDTRLSVSGAKWFATCNPASPYHYVKRHYIDNYDNIFTQHYSLRDNPYLNQEYIDALLNNYSGVFRKRYIDGEWVISAGAVYDFFDESYILKKENIPKAKKYYIGIDYGTQNATVFLLVGYNPFANPVYWLEKEYYYSGREEEAQKSPTEFAEDFEVFVSENVDKKEKIGAIIYDPSALQFEVELRNRGYINTLPGDNDILNGILNVTSLMKNGKYMISEECENNIRERYNYMWDEKASEKGQDIPMKVDDHTMDAERYIFQTLFSEGLMSNMYKYI